MTMVLAACCGLNFACKSHNSTSSHFLQFTSSCDPLGLRQRSEAQDSSTGPNLVQSKYLTKMGLSQKGEYLRMINTGLYAFMETSILENLKEHSLQKWRLHALRMALDLGVFVPVELFAKAGRTCLDWAIWFMMDTWRTNFWDMAFSMGLRIFPWGGPHKS